jgi:hypothetical protein
VPVLSRFYGIAIYIYYADHAPPHFHARYSGKDAQFAIADASIIAGDAAPRVASLVREWAALHREELTSNWERAQRNQPLVAIDPLP